MLKSVLIWLMLVGSVSVQAQTTSTSSTPGPVASPPVVPPPQEERILFGIGVGFSPISIAGDDQNRFGNVGITDVYVPIQLGPNIRIEPQLGLYFQNAQQTLRDSIGNFLQHNSRQIVRSAMGVFYTSKVDEQFQFGIGARLGILSSEYELKFDRQSALDSNHNENYAIFYTAACFTTEYWFSKHFSIGGEIQLYFYNYGSPITTPIKDSYSPNTSSQTVISTSEVLAARFYF
jgi:hypothetical protein